MEQLFWYELVRRPVSIGTQPDKGLIEIDYERKNYLGRHYGAVGYDRELSNEEIEEFELNPLEKEINSDEITILSTDISYTRDADLRLMENPTFSFVYKGIEGLFKESISEFYLVYEVEWNNQKYYYEDGIQEVIEESTFDDQEFIDLFKKKFFIEIPLEKEIEMEI